MNAWYAMSDPLEVGKYSVFSDKLKQICEFNGITPPPEIRMLEIGTCAADSVNNRIYISPMFAAHMVKFGSEEQLACIAAHELAHIVLGHDKPVKKAGEYLVDRIGAAFIGDEALYKQSLITQNAFTQEFQQPEKEAAKNATGITGVLLRFGQWLKEKGQQKIYGTPAERFANIQYDIDRCALLPEVKAVTQAAQAGQEVDESIGKIAEKAGISAGEFKLLMESAPEGRPTWVAGQLAEKMRQRNATREF